MQGVRWMDAGASRESHFIMTVGPPGSGKSTWANRKEEQGWRVIRPDTIRWDTFEEDFHPLVEGEVWGIVAASLKGLFKLYSQAGRGSGHIILDATNLTRAARSRWINLARYYGFSPRAAVFAVSLKICIDKNAKRPRMVPEDVLKRLYESWEFPWYGEALDEISILTPFSQDIPADVLRRIRLVAPNVGPGTLEACRAPYDCGS